MPDYATISVDTDKRGVVSLILNRPDKRNALSARMIAELTDFAETIGAAPATRAVILSGAGKMFCAGGDLEWMQAQIHADRATRMAEARKLAMMLSALNTMPAPLIGQIHGGAFGGGVGLAAVCDIALAQVGTRFGLTETRLGLIPATIGPYVIARLGEGHARRVFMSSRRFDAREAQTLDLIADVVAPEAVADRVEAEVTPYLSVSPTAVAAAKRLARSMGPPINPEIIDATITRLADTWETADAAEGIAAFLEKRPPSWDRN